MEEQEEQQPKKPGVISTAAKAGLTKLFNKLPTKYKLIVIGLIPVVFLFLLLLLVAVLSILGPIQEVVDYMKGIFIFDENTSQVEIKAADDFRNKYKTYKDLYEEENFKGELFLATLFYNPKGTCDSTDPNCGTGLYEVSFIRKREQLVNLVENSYIITKITYTCSGDEGKIISEEKMPLGTTLEGLGYYTCENPDKSGNGIDYSVAFDETLYDTYVTNDIKANPAKYGIDGLYVTVSDEVALSTLSKIKESEYLYSDMEQSIIEWGSTTDPGFGELSSGCLPYLTINGNTATFRNASCVITCSAPSTGITYDPSAGEWGQFYRPAGGCSGTPITKGTAPAGLFNQSVNLNEIFAERMKNFINVVNNRFGKSTMVGNSGYRTYCRQVELAVSKKIISDSCDGDEGMAAKPGTSNHGWGIALDVSYNFNGRKTEILNWIYYNAQDYGVTNTTVRCTNVNKCWQNPGGGRTEHWHFVPYPKPISR